jgi:ABC-type glycerol-3-phosphate transport system permease component
MKLAGSFVDPHGNTLVTVTVAAIAIYITPMIVLYFVGQKQLVQGIITTGVK